MLSNPAQGCRIPVCVRADAPEAFIKSHLQGPQTSIAVNEGQRSHAKRNVQTQVKSAVQRIAGCMLGTKIVTKSAHA